ncbi:DNA primase [Bosea sp. 62]|uniref:DNA primase n=1 Tax=unclassified Bosea (in: a-proteobacteria) TaxID=2653178 RepID=UPI00125AB56D|nr:MULTISPECIES: DNA primase [unclassified Bosea (in: a-proteobacteria)]CAD5246493.1 DNA primase [Bosea sp. 46]CAD5248406.1 DNA primase [Bosea sp. 21B]CAD5267617.1 DNA primase [Bosea sp. 7B]VVT45476.1 DNA primase [Bosea sp. EC-HK365B]VXA94558.1 DNA primase [Bosea sp. 29B]
MKFPPSVLEEIKARLPVSAVVGKRVRLSKAGREWKGLSPFNAEKTPSFFVNDQKGSFFDFSSGKNGDIFKFVMETEGLSFPEAVEKLASEAGVILPKVSVEAQVQEEKRKGLHEVVELAARFFEAELQSERGGLARRYLSGRGLEGQARQLFRMGYAPPDRFALRDHLAGKGVGADAMMETGLLVHGEEIAVPYDRFRDRVMFPIHDARGRVIAFGGRAMSADVPAKYLNSPETPLFHKGGLLFNHHNARKAAHDTGQVIVVEGYVDVIAMTLAGFPQVVAPLGTALTEDQLALLWRMAGEPVICLDGDKAGRKAAGRAIDLALPMLEPGRSLSFALLPEGQDPDDLARSGGKPAVAEVIGSAKPLVDMLWAREFEASQLDTPERRAAFERRLKEPLGLIRDEATRRHYRREIDERLGQLFAPPQQERFESRRQNGFGGGNARGGGRGFPRGPERPPLSLVRPSPQLASSQMMQRRHGENTREAFILLALASHPDLVMRCVDEIAELALDGTAAERFRQALVEAAFDGSFDQEAFERRLEQTRVAEARAALLAVTQPAERLKLAQTADPESVFDSIRQALVLHHRARTLHSELKAAERALADEPTEANFAWMKDVKARLETIEGTEANPEK